MADRTLETALRAIIEDIRVELAEEFDRNFERQAFFTEAWQRRKSPGREGGAILIGTGRLRRSLRSEARHDSVVFSSDHPAAAIHNDGGEIVVTAKMKRYFRARFYEAQGLKRGSGSGTALHRRPLSDGGFYAWTEKMKRSPEAEFWRLMAMKRVGSVIKMPRRRFIGESPEVEKMVEKIITDGLTEFFNETDITRK